MLNLTNRDCDQSARTLDEAVTALRELAGHHAQRHDAMRFVREYRLADYHQHRREYVLAVIGGLADLAQLLRDREPPTPPIPRQRR